MHHITKMIFSSIIVLYFLGCTGTKITDKRKKRGEITDTQHNDKSAGGEDSTSVLNPDSINNGNFLTCDVKILEDQNNLRRLTNREYQFSIEDIFGIDISEVVAEFPSDDYSQGFANSYSDIPLSELKSDKYSAAAFRIAAAAVSSQQFKNRFLGSSCSEDSVCAESFIKKYLFLLFRKPPEDEQKSAYLNLFNVVSNKDENGQERGLDLFELAARISYLIWHSAPDVKLLKAAGDGSLASDQGIEQEVVRMLSSSKATRAFDAFVEEWLSLSNLDNAQRSMEFGPLDEQMLADMKEEVLGFFRKFVFEEKNAMANLFDAKKSYLSPRLATIYGLTSKGEGFQEYELVSTQHFGVMTMSGILTGLSPSDETSPVKRGFYFSEKFLCNEIAPPPADAGAFKPEVLAEDITPRERFAKHNSEESCAHCHKMTDDLGLAMETYDSIGRSRDLYETGKSIVTEGAFFLDNQMVEISDLRDLSQKIAKSQQAKDCFVEKVLQYAIGHKTTHENQCEVANLSRSFDKSGQSYKELLKSVVLSKTFRRVKTAKE